MPLLRWFNRRIVFGFEDSFLTRGEFEEYRQSIHEILTNVVSADKSMLNALNVLRSDVDKCHRVDKFLLLKLEKAASDGAFSFKESEILDMFG